MTIYVDPAPERPTLERLRPGWPLLTSTGPVEDLHAFARAIGVGTGWYTARPQPAYALTPQARERAVRAGARNPLTAVPSQREAEQATEQTLLRAS